MMLSRKAVGGGERTVCTVGVFPFHVFVDSACSVNWGCDHMVPSVPGHSVILGLTMIILVPMSIRPLLYLMWNIRNIQRWNDGKQSIAKATVAVWNLLKYHVPDSVCAYPKSVQRYDCLRCNFYIILVTLKAKACSEHLVKSAYRYWILPILEYGNFFKD